MKESKRVVIIGAGIGGLATSVFLAKKGFRVAIFEKNLYPGGRCGQIIRDGFRFDTGATMILMPEVYRAVFRDMGIDLDKDMELAKMDDVYTLWYDDGSRLAFTTDMDRLEEQLEKLEKGSFRQAKDYIHKGYEMYRLASDKLLGRNFLRLTDFIRLGNVLLLVKLKTYIRHSSYTRHFFRDDRLRMAFTFQNIYVGQSPYRSPALFSMIPAVELTDGSLFPKGGMYALTVKLTQMAESLGVKIHTVKPVISILVRNDKATGVVFGNGSFTEADIVVANADLPYVYRELLPPSRAARHLEKKRYSCSALVFHWGVSKVYPQLAHHNIFLSNQFREGLKTIFRDQSIGEDPSFYIHAPVRTDPTAAPEGCDALTVIIGAGHVAPSNRDKWDILQQNARRAVIRKLKAAGLTDIEEHIHFEVVCTPADWEGAVNVTHGSVFGSLAHNILQMGYFRPHNRDRRYHNLYFAGGSTHPGNGVPNVLLSAKLVSERIIQENPNPTGNHIADLST